MRTAASAVRDRLRFAYLSSRLIAGRWFWAVALVPLLWLALLILRLAVGWREEAYDPVDVQNVLIGVPLAVLAVGLGVRIIAGEIDQRTLEIAYTVPGGARRVWLGKLAAAGIMLVVAELLLAVVTGTVLIGWRSFPFGSLYPPLQAAAFYLVVAMALSALFKSEVTGALVTVPVLLVGLLASGTRASPFFNSLRSDIVDTADPSDILAWTVQNRVAFALLIAAVGALAFTRAERRERMMSG